MSTNPEQSDILYAELIPTNPHIKLHDNVIQSDTTLSALYASRLLASSPPPALRRVEEQWRRDDGSMVTYLYQTFPGVRGVSTAGNGFKGPPPPRLTSISQKVVSDLSPYAIYLNGLGLIVKRSPVRLLHGPGPIAKWLWVQLLNGSGPIAKWLWVQLLNGCGSNC